MMEKKRIYCAIGYECNNNCIHCAVDPDGFSNKALSLNDISGVLEKIRAMGRVEIEFSGGEPTLRPELFYFLERLCTSFPEIRHTLLSNGRTFSRSGFAAKFSEYNPYSILIPVHGDTPQLHDTVSRAPGSFEETMLGIRNLYDYGMPVGLKSVVNRLNYARMPQFVEMVIRRFPECRSISLNGLEMQGRALKNKDSVGVRLSEIAPYVERAIDVAKSTGFKVVAYSIPPCILGEDYRKYAGIKKRSSVISKTPKVDMCRVKLMYGTVEKCAGCRHHSVCTGAWYSYFDVYGTDEINPIA